MGYNRTSLEDFSATLSNITANFKRLAQAILLDYEQDSAAQAHLNKVSQQLIRLAEVTQSLNHYLTSGVDTPPADDSHWPLIRVLQSQEEEQTQLARELERVIGQLLANSVVELASCQQLLGRDDEAVASGLSSLQQELEQGLADTRWFITGLEPTTILGNFGLSEGLRRYLEKYESRTNLQVQLLVQADIGRLPKVVELAIFRIHQEALNNIHQHAKADSVGLTIDKEDSNLIFQIVDNGQGFIMDDISHTRKNFGLARMVDYAELLSGHLKIYSGLNQGTKVVLAIPFPQF